MGPESGVTDGTTSPPSIGGYLSRQRRLRGISLDELAALTHIPRRSLERLEAGAFDRTQDGFARGFVRAVAGAIGLDPEDAVARMLEEVRPAVGPRTGPIHAVLVAVTLAVLLAGLVVVADLRGAPAPEATAAPSEGVAARRRDFVRELAEQVAAARAAAPMPEPADPAPEEAAPAP
jgi:hypothetical protein